MTEKVFPLSCVSNLLTFSSTITLGALLFGSLKAISAGYTAIDINGDGVAWLATLGISKYIYNVLPYIITLVVLAFTSKSSRAPKAEGQPYDKGKR